MAVREQMMKERRCEAIEATQPRLRLGNEKSLADFAIDEKHIPIFSKEVPTASKGREAKGTVTVRYRWAEQQTASEIDSIKIDHVVFRKGCGLEGLSKINQRDGFDRLSLERNGATYFLRKTNEDVARALYNAASMIKGAIENIVGYLKTLLGNFYVISQIERGSWTFDRELSGKRLNLADVSKFDAGNRERLVELVAGRLKALHRQKLVLGRFSLGNLLITTRDLVFTDLRKMRVSRKSAYFVDEFVSAMRYLLENGIARKADVVHAAMDYAVEMQDECECWYRERHGKRASDEMDVVSEMEGEIGG